MGRLCHILQSSWIVSSGDNSLCKDISELHYLKDASHPSVGGANQYYLDFQDNGTANPLQVIIVFKNICIQNWYSMSLSLYGLAPPQHATV
jgi:hypothetical protein